LLILAVAVVALSGYLVTETLVPLVENTFTVTYIYVCRIGQSTFHFQWKCHSM